MSAESTSAAAPASAAGKASKKQQKKDEKKTKKNESAEFDYTTLPASTIKLFLADDSVANLKVALIAALCSAEFVPISGEKIPVFSLFLSQLMMTFCHFLVFSQKPLFPCAPFSIAQQYTAFRRQYRGSVFAGAELFFQWLLC